MLNHCKNNVIHRKINGICIAWMLNHCKNNAIHCKINDICIVWMLNHCKNNVIHCEINANPMRIQCRTIQIHSTPYKSHTQLTKLTQIHTNPQKSIQIHNIYIYICLTCYIPTKSPACMQVPIGLHGFQRFPLPSTCVQCGFHGMQSSIPAASRR